jgi:hypothetical protein
MISFEYSDSPFFEAHKHFCDELVASLASQNAILTGECTSYGYRVTAQFNRGPLNYDILFIKAQFTQDGIIIPKHSNVYAGTQFRVSGLPTNYKIKLGRSRLKRLFTQKEFKSVLPVPYYLFTNHPSPSNLIGSLIPFLTKNEVDTIRIKGGKALLRIHRPVSNPMPVIEAMESVIREIG